MMFFYSLLKRILFLFDPENMHALASYWIKFAGGISIKATGQHSNLKFKLFNHEVPNPLSMAAGFDKTGELVNGLCGYGFGYVETGTFTKTFQEGNSRPRVFRIPSKNALFNRMGFNNPGIKNGIKNLEHARFPFALSIGKSKETEVELAKEDYRTILEEIENSANQNLKKDILYIAVNVSSPNTPGLRQLQDKKNIETLIKTCKKTTKLPVVVKFSPDFNSLKEFEDLLKKIISSGADGVIVTNTTTDPSLTGIVDEGIRKNGGGLSGDPLRSKAEEYLNSAVKICYGKIPVISSGGVMTKEDVWNRLEMGASAVQVYTGFIYNGPGFVAECLDYIENKLVEFNYKNLEDFFKKRKISK